MEIFKRLQSFYMPYKKLFITSLIFMFFVTGITVVYPIVLQMTIDDVVLGEQYDLIPYLAFGFVGIMIVKGIGTFVYQYTGEMFGITSVYRLRNELYKKLQYLPYRYYDNAKTGDLMSRLTADVEGFRFFLSFGFSELIRFFILILSAFAVMFYYSPSLTFVTLATLPFLAVAVYRFDKRVHPAFRSIRKSFGQLNTNVQENISGINTVKSLSRESYQTGKFNDSNGTYKDNYISTSNIWAKFFPLMELLGNLSIVLLLGYGGYLVIEGSLQLGELVAFYSLIWYIIWPITNLGFVINLFSQSKASGERLLEILDAEEDIQDAKDAEEVESLKGHVQFTNVTHRYHGYEEKALSDVSFTALPGQTIGLIGATGSGKTTVTQLLARYYEPEEGSILIDGKPTDAYTLNSLRKNIGFVMQESFLFSSSIKSNIAYGRPGVSMEDIIEAAKRADAHEFIMELPKGYDTLLGERGLGLSGGQKQRIAIARAICTDPSILVLDDATSAVDMETEHTIQQALKEVMKGRTTFVIAHRISSVKQADQILVFDKGSIVERGTHETLINQSGPYRRIYDIQFKDMIEEEGRREVAK
ncbi:ABC transporter ATP-binding protein [Mangrovibacillus cuniculi]|uniref:ABC transporter ATP-binding protein n=1 Tax=Mangrovibacillus cuniculi TaxID=2593652 RepID=A0A7S8CA66_9BACI|nr:ABC transporter ATP-binding protein [Mangrovibacillus cuniculi]QPC46182.1 ABC transporter ATP-binding protein [Mangrovibacillus cuniculi]